MNPFSRLWAGQTISEFGSMLGVLSLLAILDLEATPAQMGLLETFRSLPLFLIGLLAGVWVDKLPQRPILIVADVGRAVLLLAVPLLAWWGRLEMWHLYGVVFGLGLLTVFFDVAYQSFLPALIPPKDLISANSKLSGSSAVAEMASPAVGSLLVQWLTAPIAVLIDAGTFLLSATFIATISPPNKPTNQPTNQQTSFLADLQTGIRFLWQQPYLRPLVLTLAWRNFFGAFYGALYALFVLNTIGLSVLSLGILVGSGGVGALFASFFASRWAKKFGYGRLLIATLFLFGLVGLLIPIAGIFPSLAFLFLLIAQLAGDTVLTVTFISERTLRQLLTPQPLLGRMNATVEFLTGTAGIFGLIVGGWLGSQWGLQNAVWVASGGLLIAGIWLWLSPIRHLNNDTIINNQD